MTTLSTPRQHPLPPTKPATHDKLAKMEAMQMQIQRMMGSFQHSFMLIKQNTWCFQDDISVDFTPRAINTKQQKQKPSLYREFLELSIAKSRAQGTPINPNIEKIHPVFNKDQRYFTPTFIVGEDAVFYEETPNLEYQKFQEKKKQAIKMSLPDCPKSTKINKKKEEKRDIIWRPKPKRNYCHVCKKEYEDYVEHIRSKLHIGKIKKNPCNKYIHELAANYQHKIRAHDNSQSQDTESCLKNAIKTTKNKKITKNPSGKLQKIPSK